MRAAASALAPLVLMLVLGACANPINQATYQHYYQAGLQAQDRGDLEQAREMYRRALINAEIGYLGDGYKAGATYQLARVSGFLCDFDAADAYFRQSIELEEKASPGTGVLTRKLLEYARFLDDRGRAEESLSYFERGLDLAIELGVEKEDPIGLSDVLDEYAGALRSAGRTDDATTVVARAESMRAAHPGATAIFEADSYAGDCTPPSSP